MGERIPLRIWAVAGLILAASLVAVSTRDRLPGASADQQPASWVHVPDDLGEPIRIKYDPDQVCKPGALSRPVSESWESVEFPSNPRYRKWRSFDEYAPIIGLYDEIEWGRCASEASLGNASAWSVGGGGVGGNLDCAQKQYPSGPSCRSDGTCRIFTTLQYYFLELDTPAQNWGLRITFDYRSKSPEGAFLVGAVDLDADPDPAGRLPVYSDPNLVTPPNTAGQWLRGMIAELTSPNVNNKKRVALVFQYKDDEPEAGMEGVFIDNIHVDVKFAQNPCPVPSYTVTPTPSPILSPTPTGTNTPYSPPTPSNTPSPLPRVPQAMLPLALNNAQARFPQVPTAPTPSTTPTASNTPTPTSTPSSTPTVTPRPTITLTPTWTPPPIPLVGIANVLYTTRNPRDRREIVVIQNVGTAEQSLDGWRLYAKKASETCRFPDGVVLQPMDKYEMRSGKDAQDGEVNGVPGHKCSDSFMWDNNADEAWLYDSFNAPKDRYCWNEEGWFWCPLP